MLPTILYIDDAPSNLFLVTLIAEDLGIQLETAATGIEGLTKAKEKKYDLILSDIRLPDISGFEILKELRLNSINSVTPIIAFTADVSQNNHKNIIENGFTDFLSKPFKDDELITKLEIYLTVEKLELDLAYYLKYITQQSQVEKAKEIILKDLQDFEGQFSMAWFTNNNVEIDNQFHKITYIAINLKLNTLLKLINDFKTETIDAKKRLLVMKIRKTLLSTYQELLDTNNWKIPSHR